jgi:hypothetical protein
VWFFRSRWDPKLIEIRRHRIQKSASEVLQFDGIRPESQRTDQSIGIALNTLSINRRGDAALS